MPILYIWSLAKATDPYVQSEGCFLRTASPCHSTRPPLSASGAESNPGSWVKRDGQGDAWLGRCIQIRWCSVIDTLLLILNGNINKLCVGIQEGNLLTVICLRPSSSCCFAKTVKHTFSGCFALFRCAHLKPAPCFCSTLASYLLGPAHRHVIVSLKFIGVTYKRSRLISSSFLLFYQFLGKTEFSPSWVYFRAESSALNVNYTYKLVFSLGSEPSVLIAQCGVLLSGTGLAVARVVIWFEICTACSTLLFCFAPLAALHILCTPAPAVRL